VRTEAVAGAIRPQTDHHSGFGGFPLASACASCVRIVSIKLAGNVSASASIVLRVAGTGMFGPDHTFGCALTDAR
jgi:hypothetical protein